jgi:hypothetical protein
LGREVRIEFVNDDGRWEVLAEVSPQYVSLHKERTIAGKSRVGFATTFKAIAADNGEVLGIWHSAT